MYYANFRKDPWQIKIYVAVLLLADTLNTSFNITWIYKVLVNNFGNMEALTRADWLNASEHAMAGLVAMMCQMFYARRIFILTKNRWVTALIATTSCLTGICATGTAIAVGMRPEFTSLQSLKVIALPWLISGTICDVTIATTLSVSLSKRRTGFERTDALIKRVILATISNGLLTASFTTSHMISYLASVSHSRWPCDAFLKARDIAIRRTHDIQLRGREVVCLRSRLWSVLCPNYVSQVHKFGYI
ncbi:uncharacterized protein PHACADRAFT_246619 [Phanerochaete carnosa HHB-10118-sp]|uniref:DUF6534 domain-containing protein n=1 Tax=Phanerochaete carnosa (strain HHB-10118-sp) TaxID=650164 RepID=K5W9F6_PHACS|nr:uncharacterized protein PHACADRAFT_246619 [Phanerochaete carnosa HHB-10118-sp]EKM60593.1 hypothetical protein PHACADRAFT_246619 [Phanerochaete carnosa HHB-10118-sp]